MYGRTSRTDFLCPSVRERRTIIATDAAHIVPNELPIALRYTTENISINVMGKSPPRSYGLTAGAVRRVRDRVAK